MSFFDLGYSQAKASLNTVELGNDRTNFNLQPTDFNLRGKRIQFQSEPMLQNQSLSYG